MAVQEDAQTIALILVVQDVIRRVTVAVMVVAKGVAKAHVQSIVQETPIIVMDVMDVMGIVGRHVQELVGQIAMAVA